MQNENIDSGYMFIFDWDGEVKTHNKQIKTFNEMILTIRELFNLNFNEEKRLKYYYVDVDQEFFELCSQIEYKQISDYHSRVKKTDGVKIKIVSEEPDLDISNILNSTKINFAESKINCIENKLLASMVPTNKKDLFDHKQEINVATEIKSLREFIGYHNLELVEYIKDIIELNCKKLENKIENFSNKDVSQVPSKKEEVTSLLNDENVADEINEINDSDIASFYCTICYMNNAKYYCVICDNLFICKHCENNDSHPYHPRLSMSSNTHFNVRSISSLSLSSNTQSLKDQFYFQNNKNYFNSKLTVINLGLSCEEYITNKLTVKVDTKIDIPIIIKNESNINISANQLIVCCKNCHPVKAGNTTITSELKKSTSITEYISITLPNTCADYSVEVVIYHISRRLDCPSLILQIRATK